LLYTRRLTIIMVRKHGSIVRGQLRRKRYAKKANASTTVVSALARGEGAGDHVPFLSTIPTLFRGKGASGRGRVAQAAWSSALQRP